MKAVPIVFDFVKQKNPATDALWLMGRMGQEFPGLVNGKDEVGGGDLVDWITMQIHEMDPLRQFMEEYMPEPDADEEEGEDDT